MFQNANSISTTVGFTSLDITGMTNHNYTNEGTLGWTPRDNILLFAIRVFTTWATIKITDLIYLGNAKSYTDGTSIGNVTPVAGSDKQLARKIKAVWTQNKWWGNPFDPDWHVRGKLLQTNKTFQEIYNHYKNKEETEPINLPEGWFVEKTTFTFNCRYSPQADKGINNKVYLIDLNDKAHTMDWTSAVAAPNSLYDNLPIWLTLWGYLDYSRKCGQFTTIDTRYLLVFYCEYLEPKDKKYFVPLDLDFLEGRSPYADQVIIYPSDMQTGTQE